MTVLITLTAAGTDTGPFDLYSDADGFVSAFETGVSKAALLAGYPSSLVPNTATVIRIKSSGICNNYIDITLVTTTTTTSSSTSTSTTSSTSSTSSTTSTTSSTSSTSSTTSTSSTSSTSTTTSSTSSTSSTSTTSSTSSTSTTTSSTTLVPPPPTTSTTSSTTTIFDCATCNTWEYDGASIPLGGDVVQYYRCLDGVVEAIPVNYGDPSGQFCNCDEVGIPYSDNGTVFTLIGSCNTTTTTSSTSSTTTTTTTCLSPCLNIEYSVTGSGTAEWYECQTGNIQTQFVNAGVYSFCNDGSGVVFYGGASGTPTGNQTECGCNDLSTTTTTSSTSTTTSTTTISPS